MKTILTALIALSVPAMVLASAPNAHKTTTTTTTHTEKTTAPAAAATTWNGELAGVTTANQEMVKAAIAKIPGVESVTIDAMTGKTSISGKNFTPAQVASALPTGISLKK